MGSPPPLAAQVKTRTPPLTTNREKTKKCSGRISQEKPGHFCEASGRPPWGFTWFESDTTLSLPRGRASERISPRKKKKKGSVNRQKSNRNLSSITVKT